MKTQLADPAIQQHTSIRGLCLSPAQHRNSSTQLLSQGGLITTSLKVGGYTRLKSAVRHPVLYPHPATVPTISLVKHTHTHKRTHPLCSSAPPPARHWTTSSQNALPHTHTKANKYTHMLSPTLPTICRCSSSALWYDRPLSPTIRSPVHDVVMEDVCCPANSTAISRPVISSSLDARPPFTFWYLHVPCMCVWSAYVCTSACVCVCVCAHVCMHALVCPPMFL